MRFAFRVPGWRRKAIGCFSGLGDPRDSNLRAREDGVRSPIPILGPTPIVDRAKAFHVEQVGFQADFDHRVNDEIRFVQLTPPGSACSIAFGQGITDMPPGSQRGIQVVVDDAQRARAELIAKGVDVSEVDITPWGHFDYFSDPDGNAWALQQLVAVS